MQITKEQKWFKIIGLIIVIVIPFYTQLGYLLENHPVYTRSVTHVLWGEGYYWLLFIIVLLIARFGENDPLNFSVTGKNIVRTGAIIVFILTGLLLVNYLLSWFYHDILMMRHQHELLSDIHNKYPAWLKVFISLTAGIFEETFFRAYAISRILQLTGNKMLAYVVPLIVFSVGHLTYGTLYHVLAAMLDGIFLTIIWVKGKSLIANSLGHAFFDMYAFFY